MKCSKIFSRQNKFLTVSFRVCFVFIANGCDYFQQDRKFTLIFPPSSFTMVGCVVPGCTNRSVHWTARFPEDDQLRASWRAAIFGGTGRKLTEATLDGKHVCQMHFPAHQQPERGQMYREPTLYLVDRTWVEVSCCQLCLEYKPVTRMFNRKYCLEQSFSLQSLAYKYFRVRQFVKSTTQESYFCEACVVQLDITHRFCEQINENARAYERMLRKMSKTMVIFDGPEEFDEDEDEVVWEDMDGEDQDDSRQVDVKEEPEDARETGVCGQLKSEPVAENDHLDCEIEENQLETIEVDDDDDAQTAKIKIEPVVEETPVMIKQEVLDEDPPPTEMNDSVQVKEEPAEERESSPSAKKQCLESKYGCLTCKANFNSQRALAQHLQEVAHDKFHQTKCVSCQASILPRLVKKPKCGKCENTNRDVDSTKSPKILNLQLTKEKVESTTYRCGPCNRTFSTEVLLTHHQKQLTCKSPKNICKHCNEPFLLKDDLIAHMELAHVAPRRSKECAICGEAIPAILFELHIMLLCGVNLPILDETYLKQCALLFFRQKHHPQKAYEMLRRKFDGMIRVTSAMVDTWYAQFDQGDVTLSNTVQASIKQLIYENATISLLELSEQTAVDLETVRLRTGLIGMMQKYGRWVPQELPPSLMKNRLNYCRALLARYKNNTSLNNIILCSERWVYYGNGSHQPVNATKEPTHKMVLLCVWWDQRGLIFHELLEPQQAAAPDRFHSQFSRFTKAMQSARQTVPRNVSFQYGITDQEARVELKAILAGIGWELLRHPVHSPDIDPTDYHLFQLMQHGFQNLYFANPGQVYEWVAKVCKEQMPVFYLRGIRMLLQRWQKVVELKGDYCGQ